MIPDDIMKTARKLYTLLFQGPEMDVVNAFARALLAEREANAARIGKIEALCTQHAEARSALSTDLLSALNKLAAFRAIEEAFLAERQSQAARIAALEVERDKAKADADLCATEWAAEIKARNNQREFFKGIAERNDKLEALLKEAVMLLRSAVAPMAAYPADGPNAEEVLRRGDRIEEFLAKTAARTVAEKLKGAGE